ncbi:MAG: M67 family metallopeptidase [Candidatus Promineifilaceae bacterium]
MQQVLAGLRIPRPQYETLLSHLQSCYPQEGCGFLAGHFGADRIGQITQVYPIPNTLARTDAFFMSPPAMIKALLSLEAQGLSLLAIYHSHPQTAAAPSSTDIALAYYPEAAQVIVSLQEWSRPQSNAYIIVQGLVQKIAYQIL